ncbi:hypothetical protein [Streptomyces sp. NPDC021020]|uniref:hypothetical protein n=1 Tax=Streptomyces sp. NPDC021020 TaxID=3365109 RepID=UPI0037B48CEA
MDFEDRLNATLRHAAEAFTPDDPSALVAAGHARGRRLRRRRTAGVVAGAVALVLVVVGGVTAAAVLPRPGGPADVLPPATTRPVVSGEEMSAALTSRLPSGPVTNVMDEPPRTGAHPAPPSAYALLQGDLDSYEVGVSVGNADSGDATCPSPTPPAECSVLPAKGGSLVITATPEFTKDGFHNPPRISVWFYKDHYAVAVEERGSMRGAPDDFLLDQADLIRIAVDDVWKDLAATLPPSIPGPAL